MTTFCQTLKQSSLITLVVTLLGGCAASSVFTSYPSQIQTVKVQIEASQFKLAEDDLEKHREDADKILYMMERGRTAQIANDNKTSMADYLLAKDAIAALEQKAIISASDTASQGAALLTNDNAIPYEGEPYERIFLYHFQAMNYLFSRDLDGAMVEIRRANEEQQLAFQKHEEEIAKIQKNNREALDKNKSVMNSFKGLVNIANRVNNSFQNAYTFYASGVLWELNGKPNDAYIDYKKALEIFPDNIYIQKDVLRLAKSLAMKEDLARFEKLFKVESSASIKNGGELIIFFEHGFAPIKEEVKIALATISGIHSVAFPTYAPKWSVTPPLMISDSSNNALLGTTSPIVYVQALATKALQEDLPGIMTRQILRIVAKKEATKQSGKAFGDLGSLASTLFNLATENADRRSWLTLPNDAQIYRSTLAGGDHTLQLTNGLASDSVAIKIVPGKKTILRVISTGKTMHTNSIVL